MTILKDVEKAKNEIQNLFIYFKSQEIKNKRKLINMIKSFSKEFPVSNRLYGEVMKIYTHFVSSFPPYNIVHYIVLSIQIISNQSLNKRSIH
jgi:hypothetical protein